jgi:hypothetical protein
MKMPTRLKLILTVLFFVVAFLMAAYSQTIIENPAKPESAKSGRAVELKEVMRIAEESQEFYFKYPRSIKVAPDGSIFVQDENEFLQFDKNGKFIGNYFKKGQGPNEMERMGQYLFAKDYLIVHCNLPNKVLWFDYNGQVVKEIMIHEMRLDFQFLCKDMYYFLRYGFPKFEKREEIFGLNYELVSLSADGKDLKALMSFPTLYYAYSEKGAGAIIPVAKLVAAPFQGRFLFISHTSEYLIKVFDAEANQLVRSFERKYHRVNWDKNRKRSGVIIGNKPINPPPQKYENDIRELWVHGDKLWVVTSTFDKDKGFLVDVFDVDGKFLDSFFLRQPDKVREARMDKMLDYGIKIMTVDGEFLYTTEEDESGNLFIVKYRMENLVSSN